MVPCLVPEMGQGIGEEQEQPRVNHPSTKRQIQIISLIKPQYFNGWTDTFGGLVSSMGSFVSVVVALFAGRGDSELTCSSALSFRFGLPWRLGLGVRRGV